ncbi:MULTISPECIES: hypothetical protein [Rhodococcus]|uniref:hypothetical protein n=1 Tax=Rhodococcus TaxID=1827 RepID=UPI001009C2C6|nr:MULTISPECIES: hypothetical protein [Rhodococcus]WAM13585.1 hypothetical protein OYT95_29775 [Rhodococcus sp. JS3073]
MDIDALSFVALQELAGKAGLGFSCDARVHMGIRVEGKPGIVGVLPIVTSEIDPAVHNWVVTSGTEAPPAAVTGTTLPLAGFENNP